MAWLMRFALPDLHVAPTCFNHTGFFYASELLLIFRCTAVTFWCLFWCVKTVVTHVCNLIFFPVVCRRHLVCCRTGWHTSWCRSTAGCWCSISDLLPTACRYALQPVLPHYQLDYWEADACLLNSIPCSPRNYEWIISPFCLCLCSRTLPYMDAASAAGSPSRRDRTIYFRGLHKPLL